MEALAPTRSSCAVGVAITSPPCRNRTTSPPMELLVVAMEPQVLPPGPYAIVVPAPTTQSRAQFSPASRGSPNLLASSTTSRTPHRGHLPPCSRTTPSSSTSPWMPNWSSAPCLPPPRLDLRCIGFGPDAPSPTSSFDSLLDPAGAHRCAKSRLAAVERVLCFLARGCMLRPLTGPPRRPSLTDVNCHVGLLKRHPANQPAHCSIGLGRSPWFFR